MGWLIQSAESVLVHIYPRLVTTQHHPAPTKHTPDIPPPGSQLPVVAPRIRGIAQSREMCSVRDNCHYIVKHSNDERSNFEMNFIQFHPIR